MYIVCKDQWTAGWSQLFFHQGVLSIKLRCLAGQQVPLSDGPSCSQPIFFFFYVEIVIGDLKSSER